MGTMPPDQRAATALFQSISARTAGFSVARLDEQSLSPADRASMMILLLAGGGLKMGQIIGQSNRDAGEPSSEPVKIQNLIGTILHTLFDIGKLRVTPGVAREVLRMAEWSPIVGV